MECFLLNRMACIEVTFGWSLPRTSDAWIWWSILQIRDKFYHEYSKWATLWTSVLGTGYLTANPYRSLTGEVAHKRMRELPRIPLWCQGMFLWHGWQWIRSSWQEIELSSIQYTNWNMLSRFWGSWKTHHLFCGCIFSNIVWSQLLKRMGVTARSPSFRHETQWFVQKVKGKIFRSRFKGPETRWSFNKKHAWDSVESWKRMSDLGQSVSCRGLPLFTTLLCYPALVCSGNQS